MKSIFTLVAIVIMASPSFAATTTKKTTKTTTTTTTNASPSHTATHTAAYSDSSGSSAYSASRPVSHDGLNWQAGLGLGTISSTFAFGVRAQGLVPVAKIEGNDLLVGGETGFLYGPSTPAIWSIPIMVEGQLNFRGNGKLTPYVGLSMGVSITHVDLPTGVAAAAAAFGVSTSATSTNFAMFAKGGLFFGEDQKLFAELPLGTIGSAFAIFPTFGMRF